MEAKELKFRRKSSWQTSWVWNAKGVSNKYTIYVDKGNLILDVNNVDVKTIHIDVAPLSGESDFFVKFNRLVKLANKTEKESV